MIIGIRKSVYDEFVELNKSIDRSKLVKKQVTDKNGHVRTVWVRPGDQKIKRTKTNTETDSYGGFFATTGWDENKIESAKRALAKKENFTGRGEMTRKDFVDTIVKEGVLSELSRTRIGDHGRVYGLSQYDFGDMVLYKYAAYKKDKNISQKKEPEKKEPESDNKITVDKVYNLVTGIVNSVKGASIDGRYKGTARISTPNYYIDVSGMDKITEDDVMNPYISYSVRTKAASGKGEKTVIQKDFMVNYKKGMNSLSLANFKESLKNALSTYN